MLRMGRSVGDALSDEDFEYLLNLVRNDRQVPLPRYGKDLALQYMLMNALKSAEMSSSYDDEIQPSFGFGYDLELPPGRQIRPAPRPGRYRRSAETGTTEGTDTKVSYAGGDQVYDDIDDSDSSEEKYDAERVAPLMRYGKYLDDEELDKRAMRMLRLGRGMRMLRLGKRPDDEEDYTDAEKRALRLLRLGKRPFNMLRMGRSDSDEDKRAFHMLRMGRSDLEEDKRAFHMLRMGRSDNEEDKRALRLLRLGKKSEEEKAR